MGQGDYGEASGIWSPEFRVGTEKPGAGILCQTHRDVLREEIWGNLGYTIEDPELGTVARLILSRNGGDGKGVIRDFGTKREVRDQMCGSGTLDL